MLYFNVLLAGLNFASKVFREILTYLNSLYRLENASDSSKGPGPQEETGKNLKKCDYFK